MKELMVTPEDLKAVVGGAQSGDAQAFDRIVIRQRERLSLYVGARVGDRLKTHIETEDVLQETFTRAFQLISRFQWHGDDSLHYWLCTIAERVILEAAREDQRRPRLELYPDMQGQGTSPSKILRREERFARLENALSQLSPEHRHVIVLSRIERLRVTEIAAKLDRSPDAVRQLLSRALKKLKESFGDTESFHLPHRHLSTRENDDA